MKTRFGVIPRIIVLALAASALVPLLGVDPAIFALLLDVDFLIVTGVVGLTMLGRDASLLRSTFARTQPMLWVRVGFALTRSDPSTLIR